MPPGSGPSDGSARPNRPCAGSASQRTLAARREQTALRRPAAVSSFSAASSSSPAGLGFGTGTPIDVVPAERQARTEFRRHCLGFSRPCEFDFPSQRGALQGNSITPTCCLHTGSRPIDRLDRGERSCPETHLRVQWHAAGHDAAAGLRAFLPIVHVVLLKRVPRAEAAHAGQPNRLFDVIGRRLVDKYLRRDLGFAGAARVPGTEGARGGAQQRQIRQHGADERVDPPGARPEARSSSGRICCCP